MKREDDLDSNHQNILNNWIKYGPDYSTLNLNALGVLINNCIANASTAISFDGKAFHTANGGDKDLQFLKKISKIHLEYVQKEETEVYKQKVLIIN